MLYHNTRSIHSELTFGTVLGVGAFGQVFLGKWRGTHVAIKQLICSTFNEATLMEFKSEVAVLSALRHPNICLFLGATTLAPNFVIVTEFLVSCFFCYVFVLS